MTRVFDASAVLAAIFQEPGSEQVAQLWQDGDNLISAVSYSEVVAKLSERGLSDAEVMMVMEGVPLTVVSVGQDTAHAAGLMRQSTRALGLSLGDRACLALALAQKATAVTADQQWQKVQGVDLMVIR
jgi:ribonuclease VapC